MASVTLEMTQKEYDKFKTFLTEAVAEMKATRLTMREQQKGSIVPRLNQRRSEKELRKFLMN